MNILHMKYAVEVARAGSLNKAAERLYVALPNVSRSIKELEADLGITIFDRSARGMTLTPEGEEFIGYAKGILKQIDQVERLYKNGSPDKQRFSISVPRASYISEAFARFSCQLSSESAELFYKETNSSRTVSNIVREEYNLGIVRFQTAFERYYENLFEEKNLEHEQLTEFSYVLLVSKDSPLAKKRNVQLKELADYIEITHGDPYVPSLPMIDVKKAELSEFVDKRIFVFERGSQFELLEKLPVAFMWVSPVPNEILEKYHLTALSCSASAKVYKDVLIYRKGYRPTELDRRFISAVSNIELQKRETNA